MFDALRDNTAETEKLRSRVDVLENSFGHLESTLNTRMGHLEAQNVEVIGHLDKIAAESKRTNDILEKQAKAEMDELTALEEQRKETRTLVRNGFREVWETVKPSIGVVLGGVALWVLYTYFNVPTP